MFYRTRFVLIVLSEDPAVDGMELEEVLAESDTGGFVLHIEEALTEEVTAKEMVDLLVKAGSEPGFFNLDDDGAEIQEEWMDGPPRK